MRSLKSVVTNTAVPPNILQTLLNLAEFMEHEVEASRTCRVLGHILRGEGER